LPSVGFSFSFFRRKHSASSAPEVFLRDFLLNTWFDGRFAFFLRLTPFLGFVTQFRSDGRPAPSIVCRGKQWVNISFLISLRPSPFSCRSCWSSCLFIWGGVSGLAPLLSTFPFFQSTQIQKSPDQDPRRGPSDCVHPPYFLSRIRFFSDPVGFCRWLVLCYLEKFLFLEGG